jgi:hypothetical protein
LQIFLQKSIKAVIVEIVLRINNNKWRKT